MSAASSKNKLLPLQTLKKVMGAKFTSEVSEKQEGNEKDYGGRNASATFFQHWSFTV